MPELFVPAAVLFGTLGCIALWMFGSLCWEMSAAMARCRQGGDDKGHRVIRATGLVTCSATTVFYLLMGACCVLVVTSDEAWRSWFAAALWLTVLHALYMRHVERRVMRLVPQRRPGGLAGG